MKEVLQRFPLLPSDPRMLLLILVLFYLIGLIHSFTFNWIATPRQKTVVERITAAFQVWDMSSSWGQDGVLQVFRM